MMNHESPWHHDQNHGMTTFRRGPGAEGVTVAAESELVPQILDAGDVAEDVQRYLGISSFKHVKTLKSGLK